MAGSPPRRPKGVRPLPGDRPGPRPVGDSLDVITRRLGTPAAPTLGVVFARWEEVVGPAVAAHASPVSLRDGVLTVAVDQPAWATQLKLLSGTIVARLVEAGTDVTIERIDVRVDHRKGPGSLRN